ncbi:hypothetical protein GY45DRAFT_1038827 [Cubamyces sp. BRFM 1775]|nr:hypothetical protein GY45DRAFT_1038827 [Cubamyces sp. BRFM 1775]
MCPPMGYGHVPRTFIRTRICPRASSFGFAACLPSSSARVIVGTKPAKGTRCVQIRAHLNKHMLLFSKARLSRQRQPKRQQALSRYWAKLLVHTNSSSSPQAPLLLYGLPVTASQMQVCSRDCTVYLPKPKPMSE